MSDYAQYAALAGLLLGGSSIVAWILFWMRVGKQLAEGAEAKSRAIALEARLAGFQLEVAKEYVTGHDLAEAEGRTAAQFESLRGEIRTLNDRILQVITARS
jgi:hypothetical protein